MKLQDFKLTKNRRLPNMCFSYEKKTDNRKYTIFTMNGGVSFIASIEYLRMDGNYYTEFSEAFSSTNDCLNAFDSFIINSLQ